MLVDQQSSQEAWEELDINTEGWWKPDYPGYPSPMSFIWLLLGRAERRGYPVSRHLELGRLQSRVDISINWRLHQISIRSHSDMSTIQCFLPIWFEVANPVVPTLIRLIFINRSICWPVREPKYLIINSLINGEKKDKSILNLRTWAWDLRLFNIFLTIFCWIKITKIGNEILIEIIDFR